MLSFRDNTFANPEGLVAYIREQGPAARVRPDMKVVFFDDWEQPEQRLKGTAADPAQPGARSPSRRRRREPGVGGGLIRCFFVVVSGSLLFRVMSGAAVAGRRAMTARDFADPQGRRTRRDD